MKSFEETKQMASDNLSDMEHELSVLCRTHRNYMKHGAVTAATECQEKIEALECGIECESELFRMAFY